MRRYARIENNILFETIDLEDEQDITTMFHPSLVWIEITGADPIPLQGWVYNGTSFSAPTIGGQPDEELAFLARRERERLLRQVYDPGILMALRALRMASTPEQTTYAEGKIIELDSYAEALLAIPDQPGFPQTIAWPTAPTK